MQREILEARIPKCHNPECKAVLVVGRNWPERFIQKNVHTCTPCDRAYQKQYQRGYRSRPQVKEYRRHYDRQYYLNVAKPKTKKEVFINTQQ
jgi:hypothetical protein